MPTEEQSQLLAAIAAVEAQRGVIADELVDLAVAPLRARLAALLPASTPDPAQTLKQVSILFLDVVGSTTLSQRLDPEEVSAVMDGALARATAIVQAHRGKVLQYAGDNLLAAFGADESREDDAESAVRCGLGLLELGRALGAEVQAAHDHAGFDVRVGIHTGDVLLGGGVDADGTIRGIAVNIAARMEQTAPAGALRISHDTCALVRGLFEVDVQEPLAIKGVDDAVQSYLVRRAKPRSFGIDRRGIEGVATRMVGRDAELALLQAAFRCVCDDGHLAVVTVIADAGLGKSRLLREFEAWSATRSEAHGLFRGRADPQTQDQPFGLLRDVLAWRFQIADDDTLEAARAKLEQGIVPLFAHDDGPDLAEGHAHLLGHLIGIEWRDSRHLKGILDDPKQIRTRAFHAAAQLFRRVGTPVILQLEDLHWADDASLEFLNHLADVSHDVPLLILASSRPTLFERLAAWPPQQGQDDGRDSRIELKPLELSAGRLLADELLQKLPAVPAALRELVTGRADGNPFYMEELVKMLIDRGAIDTGGAAGEQWRVDAERLLVTQVPATLTGVLQARLDGLPTAEHLTLQQASVIGPVFWDQALLALDDQARHTLPQLVKRELTLPRADSNGDDLREYAFKHQLLHQVTYATVLKRTRRDLHGKLARWLAAQTGLRVNDFLGAAAGHFEQAGDVGNAAEYHARAAEHAQTRLAQQAVTTHVQRGLELIATLPEVDTRRLRWRLLDAREATLNLQGDRAGQQADIAAMAALAESLEDHRLRALAAFKHSSLAMRVADYAAMESTARQAAHWAGKTGDAELRLLAQRMVAFALASQGNLVDGEVLAREALVEARALGLHGVEARCLNTLGVIAGGREDAVAVLDLHRQSLLAFQAAGDRRNEAIVRGNLGPSWLDLGGLDQARRELDEGLRLIRANGDRALECGPLCAWSTLARWEGDAQRALVLARTALATAVAVQAYDWQAVALCRIGNAELALGRHAESEQAFEQAHARAVEIDDALRLDVKAGLARVALARGDAAAALRAIEPMLAHDGPLPGSLDGTEYPRLIELTCYQVLARAGDPRAAAWLQHAHEALQGSAARIADASLRAGFLQRIPHHREIVTAWSYRPSP